MFLGCKEQYKNVHVNIILDFPITYAATSVLCQSEWAYLHKTEKVQRFHSIIP